MTDDVAFAEILRIAPDGTEFDARVAVARPYRAPSGEWRCPVVMAGLQERLPDRHSARNRILVLSLLTAAMSVACSERAPAGINCEKLRSLSAGMPIEQVRGSLGSPPLEYGQDGHTVFSSKHADRLWGWPGPGVKLYIEFGQGRLIKADSWIRTMWRDLFDNESRPTLFTLKEDGTVKEGQDFRRIYCP
jgi:hypothetical protein